MLFNAEQQSWHNVIRENKSFKQGKIVPLDEYTVYAPIKHIEKKRVVCIYNEKMWNGGLADRLRGIISVYEVCKEQNIDLKVLFNHPFNLTLFLVPNKVNWTIKNNELNYNTSVTDHCFIYTQTNSDYEAKKQKQWFRKEFTKKYKEFHVRTNAIFSYSSDYSTLFNELFKPSTQLQSSIDKQKKNLGTNYISTSFRFLNLLNDFNEADDISKPLSEKEKNKLIYKSITQIHNLHSKYPDKRILVNSDSITFLQEAKKLDFVYVIPGCITHIGGKNKSNEYQTYEKTFLDLFMIANAEKIYLLRTGQMYNSGYPFAASKIYNRPFEKIEF